MFLNENDGICLVLNKKWLSFPIQKSEQAVKKASEYPPVLELVLD